MHLTIYEMATDYAVIDIVSDAIARDRAEIDIHLYASNSLTDYDLADNNEHHKLSLIKYLETVMRENILFMTQLLEDTFQRKIIIYHAGRIAFDERYAVMLLELDHKVDCSVIPLVDSTRWQERAAAITATLPIAPILSILRKFWRLPAPGNPGDHYLQARPSVNAVIQVYDRPRRK
ncbi:MAG: hypothetical protein ACTXOO_04505 [Sodalis sp. (in: enterobacteria)]